MKPNNVLLAIYIYIYIYYVVTERVLDKYRSLKMAEASLSKCSICVDCVGMAWTRQWCSVPSALFCNSLHFHVHVLLPQTRNHLTVAVWKNTFFKWKVDNRQGTIQKVYVKNYVAWLYVHIIALCTPHGSHNIFQMISSDGISNRKNTCDHSPFSQSQIAESVVLI